MSPDRRIVVEVRGGIVIAVYCGKDGTFPDVFIVDHDNAWRDGGLKAELANMAPLEDADNDVLIALGGKVSL